MKRRSQIPSEMRFDQFNPEFINICVEQAIYTKDLTLVTLSGTIGGMEISVTGQAKRFKGDKKKGIKADKPDQNIAYGIALGKALKAITKKVEKQATGRCKHADDMRAAKAKLKKSPSKKTGVHRNTVDPDVIYLDGSGSVLHQRSLWRGRVLDLLRTRYPNTPIHSFSSYVSEDPEYMAGEGTWTECALEHAAQQGYKTALVVVDVPDACVPIQPRDFGVEMELRYFADFCAGIPLEQALKMQRQADDVKLRSAWLQEAQNRARLDNLAAQPAAQADKSPKRTRRLKRRRVKWDGNS